MIYSKRLRPDQGIVIAVMVFLIPVAIRPFFREVGENKETANPDKEK